MTVGAWVLMTLGFIVAGLGGLRLRARMESKRLDREYPRGKA